MIVHVGNEAVLDFYLNQFTNTESVLQEMEFIRGDYHGGNTNTTGGLRVMREEVGYGSRYRSSSNGTLICRSQLKVH
jgi:hypothetical protein